MHDSKTHNLTTQYGYLIGVLGGITDLDLVGDLQIYPHRSQINRAFGT